jgi:hypothetical protein
VPALPTWLIISAASFCAVCMCLIVFAHRVDGKLNSGKGRLDQGRLIGIVGLPGFGKTSFIMHTYVIPALKQGRGVITNFSVMPDEAWPGTATLMDADSFGPDLLGIGSSLNVDKKTGQPMSGWFVDTACTCGKGHDDKCKRPNGDVPAFPCCDGFRAWRQCACQGRVLVIDESHAFLPANNSRPLPVDVLTWLTMCRKNHLMIIWATQYYKWVHSACRRLTEDVYKCEKGIVAGRHVARQHRLDNSNGELSREHASEVKYDIKSVGKYYDTYEVIVPAHTAYEMAGTMSRKNVGTAMAPPPPPRLLRVVPEKGVPYADHPNLNAR